MSIVLESCNFLIRPFSELRISAGNVCRALEGVAVLLSFCIDSPFWWQNLGTLLHRLLFQKGRGGGTQNGYLQITLRHYGLAECGWSRSR